MAACPAFSRVMARACRAKKTSLERTSESMPPWARRYSARTGWLQYRVAVKME
jgi:hypothetical protein